MTNHTLRISMLHTALRHDNVLHNAARLEASFLKALELQPDIIVMPELAVSGYEFFKAIGADWIKDVIPEIIENFARLARENSAALIVGCPRFSQKTNKYHNAAIFIDEQGNVIGEHYKINVLPGSEGWSSPGFEIKPIHWRDHKIGLLICSDAYTKNIAEQLALQGANVLISPAAWAPGFHGPNGEWEQRSQETNLCLFVCNRTGAEKNLNFEGGSSIVAAGGRRILNYSGKPPAILSVDVSSTDWFPLEQQFHILELYENMEMTP